MLFFNKVFVFTIIFCIVAIACDSESQTHTDIKKINISNDKVKNLSKKIPVNLQRANSLKSALKQWGEKPLTQQKSHAYQLLCIPQRGAMFVHIEQNKKTYQLSAKTRIGSAKTHITKSIAAKKWLQLQKLLEKTKFWNLPQINKKRGRDGVQFWFEGLKSGKYHMLYRWAASAPGYAQYLLKMRNLNIDIQMSKQKYTSKETIAVTASFLNISQQKISLFDIEYSLPYFVSFQNTQNKKIWKTYTTIKHGRMGRISAPLGPGASFLFKAVVNKKNWYFYTGSLKTKRPFLPPGRYELLMNFPVQKGPNKKILFWQGRIKVTGIYFEVVTS